MSGWTFALRSLAPAPRPLGITAEEDICQVCSETDFEQIFSDEKFSHDTIIREWEFQDSSALDKFRNSPCLICRIFALGIEEPVDGRRYSLRKFTGRQEYPDFLLALGDQSFSLIGIQEDEWPPKLLLGKSIPAFLESSSVQAAVRIIQENQIDYNILKGWIQSCQSGHGVGERGPCSPKPRKQIQSLKVIDCLTQKIEHMSQTPPYVALSYVWGPPMAQDSNPTAKNALPDLPRTVEDAIQATLKLGYQYIWVDRYCIDQHDDDDKAIQIRQMDLIYQEAEVTIVASAGDDPSFGLPGVSDFQPRVLPIQAKAGNVSLGGIVYRVNGSPAIECSKWNRRGWTFQEAVLSQRRLFFTEAGVIFDCPVMKCYEIFTFPMKTGHPMWDAGYPPCEIGENPWDIGTRLYEYTQRDLTYPSDTINGFTGVLNAFRRLKNPVRHHWGVPILPPRAENQLSRNNGSTTGFVLGLCWAHSRIDGLKSNRQAEFPSWSWAGWDGMVESNSENVYAAQGHWGLENDIIVKVETLDGNVVQWDAFDFEKSYAKNDLSAASRYLHINAWTTPLKLRYFDPEKYPYPNPNQLCVIVGQEDNAWVFDWASPMRTGVKPSTVELGDFENRTYVGIMLGRPITTEDAYPFVLVGEDKGSHIERVGDIYLGKGTLHRWLNEGEIAPKEWRIESLQLERKDMRIG